VTLTVGHVLLVAVGTILGASLGRFIKRHSPRLRYLKEMARAVLFVLGIGAAVALAAYSPGTAVVKATLVGFYVGAVYGLVASEPQMRQPPGASDDAPKG
jgi:membrane associated rhomboid family serine protease